MIAKDIALLAAGLIGAGTAVIHGVLTQKLMVRPFDRAVAGDPRVAIAIRRLVPALLHFSTACWFAGGVLLIALAQGFAPEARTALAIMVGALFLYGAVGNLWGTRTWHPGWVLMATSIGLIAFAVG